MIIGCKEQEFNDDIIYASINDFPFLDFTVIINQIFAKHYKAEIFWQNWLENGLVNLAIRTSSLGSEESSQGCSNPTDAMWCQNGHLVLNSKHQHQNI